LDKRERERWPNRAVLSEVLRIIERQRWPNRAVLSEVFRRIERQRWTKSAVGLRINECFCRVSGGVLVFSKSLAPKKWREN
jgi:hypothetical protein